MHLRVIVVYVKKATPIRIWQLYVGKVYGQSKKEKHFWTHTVYLMYQIWYWIEFVGDALKELYKTWQTKCIGRDFLVF